MYELVKIIDSGIRYCCRVFNWGRSQSDIKSPTTRDVIRKRKKNQVNTDVQGSGGFEGRSSSAEGSEPREASAMIAEEAAAVMAGAGELAAASCGKLDADELEAELAAALSRNELSKAPSSSSASASSSTSDRRIAGAGESSLEARTFFGGGRLPRDWLADFFVAPANAVEAAFAFEAAAGVPG